MKSSDRSEDFPDRSDFARVFSEEALIDQRNPLIDQRSPDFAFTLLYGFSTLCKIFLDF